MISYKFCIIIFFLFFLYKFLTPSIKKKRVRLPMWPYKLFYTDTKLNKKKFKSRILISKKYNLTGKPDFIYKNIFTHSLIPIELKSYKSNFYKNNYSPYYNDLAQLICYFIILENYFKKKPRVGLLIYRDCMFVIKNKKKFREKIICVLNNMRKILINNKIITQYAKRKDCNICKYKNTCK